MTFKCPGTLWLVVPAFSLGQVGCGPMRSMYEVLQERAAEVCAASHDPSSPTSLVLSRGAFLVSSVKKVHSQMEVSSN